MARKKKVPILSLRKVSKKYCLDESIEIHALREVDLDIYSGDFLSILGPSGSGKSTLMHIAGFLDSVSSGQVILNGKKLNSFNEEQLAHIRNTTIGFVFQQFNLLSRTSSLDNVSLPLIYSDIPKSKRLSKAKSLLEKVGLGDRLENYPNQLSGGQQQRVAIARALINDPKIIFADEPTGNLDSKSGLEIMKLLKQLNKEGKTIILVTHDQEVADYAKKQIVIKDGSIVKRK